MLGYVTVGTTDLARSGRFYDPIAQVLGTGRMYTTDTMIIYGVEGGPPGIGVTFPFDGKPQSVGNGTMVAFETTTRAQVDQIHALALANGGTCEGAPGVRGEGDMFYAAYFRDPDGNKLNAFIIGAP
ncbi:VOC family protein [Novosphingobium sp.]|uniref:VOC family protein n=1 Tax=Novosphingobium sp. TaxID=1874826 RepID=UPI003B52BA56